eukprot:c20221_g1_i7.p1 GENE.c20221_g1_i7~~c20221_g1_i7.p1  ORF type:complete len:390 (+),score=12.52 c20221_g1_i7:1475-2644(+)
MQNSPHLLVLPIEFRSHTIRRNWQIRRATRVMMHSPVVPRTAGDSDDQQSALTGVANLGTLVEDEIRRLFPQITVNKPKIGVLKQVVRELKIIIANTEHTECKKVVLIVMGNAGGNVVSVRDQLMDAEAAAGLESRLSELWPSGDDHEGACSHFSMSWQPSRSRTRAWRQSHDREAYEGPLRRARKRARTATSCQSSLVEQFLELAVGTTVSTATISRELRRVGHGKKLNVSPIDEARRLGCVGGRNHRASVGAQVCTNNIIDIDESNIRLGHSQRQFGHMFRGHRARLSSEYQRSSARLNIILAISPSLGVVAYMAYVGTMNSATFCGFLQFFVFPAIAGHGPKFLMMDNLSSHLTQEVRDVIRSAGCVMGTHQSTTENCHQKQRLLG